MINHLFCHAAVDAEVLAGNKACFIAAKVKHHMGDIQRIPHPFDGMLVGIRPLIHLETGINPTGGN